MVSCISSIPTVHIDFGCYRKKILIDTYCGYSRFITEIFGDFAKVLRKSIGRCETCTSETVWIWKRLTILMNEVIGFVLEGGSCNSLIAIIGVGERKL